MSGSDITSCKGRIHSTESFGAVDGPGIRFVVFLQGCKLRCLYCHNPDTWDINGGSVITAGELVDKIITYKSFIKNGGVTLSGGEPLLQPQFCESVIALCHENNFHVAIDTSGAVDLSYSSKAISSADMLLLDIKEMDGRDCIALTGKDNKNTIRTLDFCESILKDVWIRYVLIDGYTLNEEKLHNMGKFLSRYNCVKMVELLPYHTMGRYKWDNLNIKYKLDGVLPTEQSDVIKAINILKLYIKNVR